MGPRAAKILGAIRGDVSPVPAGIHLAPSAPVPQAVGGASSGGSRGIFLEDPSRWPYKGGYMQGTDERGGKGSF